MDELNSVDKKIYKKLVSEYELYCKRLVEMAPNDILNCSYEKVCKEELVMAINVCEISDELKNKLLNTNNLLDLLYQRWLKLDTDDLEKYRPCIEGVD